ncbi:SOS response-associated peptidase [Thalassospira lucentensis]|uniref:SOS response-associated peptidase n=1 Tax=Thalassospira lucentensis TaxID=168935 RepID=UPI00294276C2|nr:SOS response-associated peptidase [Thalassospira lucentensis]WOI09040.1 SOS response-associated peptidase [Thalassospira lucentensis]
MCGRYSHDLTWAEIHELAGLAFPVPSTNPQPNYNTAPTQDIPVILCDQEHIWGEYARWEFVPSWFRQDLSEKRPATINARAEDILDRKFYKGAVKSHRCLIPMRCFYEWHRPTDKPKQPYAIGVTGKTGFDPSMAAGIWSKWQGTVKAREMEFYTVAMLTREAGDRMARIHNREPAILTEDEYRDWLFSPIEDVLPRVCEPFPSQLLTAWPISRDINSVRNQGAHLLKPTGDNLF